MRVRAALAAVALVAASVALSAAATTPTPAGPKVTTQRVVVTERGFDTASAPPTSVVRAWSASPYTAVNMYFSGSQRFDTTQSELTAGWVAAVLANGWDIIPTVVDLQAPCYASNNKKHMSSDPTVAAQQGRAAADRAASDFAALNVHKGAPAYLDMEPFSGGATCNKAVRAFLKGWIDRFRADGFRAGVYGTPRTTIKLLVDAHRSNSSYPVPDAIWFADYNGNTTTNSSDIPSTYLPNHRIHQYCCSRNPDGSLYMESHGDETLNIDKNAIHGDVIRAKTVTLPGGPPYPYAVSGAPSSGVNMRTAPNTSSTSPGTIANGTQINIDCQAVGQKFDGDYVWDRWPNTNPTTNIQHPNVYVHDIYTNTTGGNGISTAIRHCDRIRPVASLQSLPRVHLPSSLTVSYSATDPTNGAADDRSGIGAYDVRWHRAPYNGGFGSWHIAAAKTKARQTTIQQIPPGYTYCVEVRAYDRATNRSAWTSPSCTARPLDDPALQLHTRGWTRKTSSKYYLGTYTVTTGYHRMLTRTNAQVRTVGVVATTCSTCGRIVLVLNGHRVGSPIDLHASSTTRRRIMLLPSFSALRSGTITVKTVSTGKSVQVDGLVVSRA